MPHYALESAPNTRTLLRKLRDLNFRSPKVLVGAGVHVRVTGCESGDAPVERGVRYGITDADGSQHLFELAGDATGLRVQLDGANLVVELESAGPERLEARELGVVLSLDSTDVTPFEEIFERLVAHAWGTLASR